MKIAIGSDDKKTIRRAHFGESKYFMIFEILNGEIHAQEVRTNAHACEGKHVHGQAGKIIDLLSDCQIFMGRSMGARSLKQIAARNIDVLITSIKNVNEAMTAYLDSKDEYFKYYNAELEKFCECSTRS